MFDLKKKSLNLFILTFITVIKNKRETWLALAAKKWKIKQDQ